MTHTLSSAAPATREHVPPLAARVDQLSGEGALDVFRRAMELERAGRSIVHLELGAPDVDAPPHVVEAAVAALRAGDARYVAPQGLPELREAIAADVRSRGIDASADQVIVTPSAKTAVFYAMMATVEPGSEVLVPDPGFPIYASMARFAGGAPVGYALDADNAPDVDDIARRISRAHARALSQLAEQSDGRRARCRRDMARLAELVARHDLRVVTDDIYSRLVFDGGRAPTHRRLRWRALAHDARRWLLQDVRDDRLPARLPRRAARVGGAARDDVRERPHVRAAVRPARGDRGVDRAAGHGGDADRRLSRAARSARARAERYAGRELPGSGRRVLCVPRLLRAACGARHDVARVCRPSCSRSTALRRSTEPRSARAEKDACACRSRPRRRISMRRSRASARRSRASATLARTQQIPSES